MRTGVPYAMAMVNDPEFDLISAACHAAFDEDAPAARPGPVDEKRFLRLIERHRVDAVVNDGHRVLETALSAECLAEVAFRAKAVVTQNMLRAAAYGRLELALADSGTDHLFIKGATIGALAYRSSFLKRGLDIDVLVDDIPSAGSILLDLGYASDRSDLADPEKLSRWHVRHKESLWIGKDGTLVDLHSRLTDHAALIPRIGLSSPRQSVQVPGAPPLETLADAELFAYLCVHGSSSCWFRLKWIVDLSAWLHRRGDLEPLYRRSLELGAGRTSGQALLLADRLGLLRLPTALRSEIALDGTTRRLASLALSQLRDEREPTEVRFGTAWIRASQLVLTTGGMPPVREFGRQIMEILRT